MLPSKLGSRRLTFITDTQSFEVGLTPEEKKLYSSLFKALDPNSSGIIAGDKARFTFEKSGLPVSVLSQIWQLADESNLGFLTQFGFCSAMRLIGYTQAGNRPMPGMAQRPGPLPKFAGLDLPPPAVSALQPQSTDSSSFMQSQPSAVIPADVMTGNSDPIPSISPHDLERFRQLFVKTVGLPAGELDGNQARSIFLKTKLPHQTLGLIWGLVDTLNSGKLSLASFVVAMHLIQGLLSGAIKQLPPSLPASVWQTVSATIAKPPTSRQSSVGSQHTTLRHNSAQSLPRVPSNLSVPPYEATMSPDFEWKVSPTTKNEYEAIFHSLDKSGSGQLSADQVAQFLMNSNLTQESLAGIWDLLDIQNTGVFSRSEFSIALFLVNRVRAGGDLPNIVPQSLLDSLATNSSEKGMASHTQPLLATPMQSPQKQASTIDDLAGLFSGPSPARAASPALGIAKAHTSESTAVDSLPKVRTALTGSFRPSSNFGQSLLTKPGTDSNRENPHPEQVSSPQPMPAAPPPVASPIASPAPQERRSVNYEALRSVPPPPLPAAATVPFQSPEHGTSLVDRVPSSLTKELGSPGATPRSTNDDLLADSNPEVSGRLSQALSDIANYSNQIRSLSAQTALLHEKKLRADHEYQKVMAVKTEIEAKLKLLRESYDHELELAAQIDNTLQASVEQIEALRSEASIAEAKLNALQALVREKQDALTSLEQQSLDLKQKLALLTSEMARLEDEVASKTVSADQAAKTLAVKKSQVQVAVVKVEDLKRNLADLENAFNQHQTAHAEADLEHQSLQKEQTYLEQQAYESAQRVAHLKAQQDERERQSRELAERVDALKKLNETAQLEAKRWEELQSAAVALPTANSKSVDDSAIKTASAGLVGAGVATAGIIGALGLAAVALELPAQQSTPKAAGEDPSDFYSRNPQATMDNADGHARVVSRDFRTNDIDVQEIPDLDVEFADLTLAREPQSEPGLELGNDAEAKAASSITSAEKESDGETAMTSPNFSDSNYNRLNDIPGAFLAPIRTDSLTSSVQNNPSMSVRDDNVGETSDRDTLVQDEVARPPPVHNGTGSQPNEPSDSTRFDQGYSTNSFEMGEHASLGGLTPSTKDNESTLPPHVGPKSVDEEFPPITEVEYDEDSSSDDESKHLQKYDDAQENLASSHSSAPKPSQGQDMFDSMFNELEPAKPESSNDFGGVDFDDLQEATTLSPGEDGLDEFVNLSEFAFNEAFSEAPHLQQNSAPNFGEPVDNEAANDEWDQLFAGFGNAVASDPASKLASPPVTASESYFEAPSNPVASINANPTTDGTQEIAISELTDMGFPRESAIEALEREQWNLEAATNRLLDNL